MATTYKVLAQSAPSANAGTAIYTVPAGTSTVVSTINICNRGSVGTFRVSVRPGGAALADQHYLAYETSLLANESLAVTIGVSLAATDVIEVYASTSNFSFSVFGAEIS